MRSDDGDGDGAGDREHSPCAMRERVDDHEAEAGERDEQRYATDSLAEGPPIGRTKVSYAR